MREDISKIHPGYMLLTTAGSVRIWVRNKAVWTEQGDLLLVLKRNGILGLEVLYIKTGITAYVSANSLVYYQVIEYDHPLS